MNVFIKKVQDLAQKIEIVLDFIEKHNEATYTHKGLFSVLFDFPKWAQGDNEIRRGISENNC